MSCNPTHGSFEAAGNRLLAASVSLAECGVDFASDRPASGFCASGSTTALNLSAVHPSGTPSLCASGLQCVPDAGCASGVCVDCSFGQYCPAGTSIPCAGLSHNICPAGHSCDNPGTVEECAAGRYCAYGTFDGGSACPDIGYGYDVLHDTSTYGLTLYCANGSWAPAICDAGFLCHNSSHREACPAGYKCPQGVNETVRCLPDGFASRSPETRCPVGSSSEGAKYDLAIVPMALLVLAWAVGQLAKLAVRWLQTRNSRRLVAPKEGKGRPLDRFEDGQGMLAIIVAGALDRQRGGQRSKRSKQLRLLVAKHLRREASIKGGFGKLLSGGLSGAPTERRSFRGGSVAELRHQPSMGSEGSERCPDVAPAGLALKFALRRALASRRAEPGAGENFISLRLCDVSFNIGKSTILSNLNADMAQGELCALMGESGSGKTTLLNAISGRATYGKLSGSISLNRQPLVPGPDMGFVPQAYLVQKTLTIYENLWYSSMLRLPGVSKAERREIVESVLGLLGLTACAHFSCDRENSKKKLSGGQLRRVGIGLELVTRPAILLLDEPTSALDAVNTRLVVEVLKNLCKMHGILVIASLHQPRFSVVNALDKVRALNPNTNRTPTRTLT